MILDAHVHLSAMTPGHGKMSPRLLRSLPFRFMAWRFGLDAGDVKAERELEDVLVKTIDQTPELDGVVLLAFDAVYTPDGRLDEDNTHLYVTNDYVMELAGRHPKIRVACSVHPYRKDAVAELERCVAGGAVMVKWLPITQNFDPSDARCIPFYEAMAHHQVVLLSHTGDESTLPQLNKRLADPALLAEALRRGVKVIAAHCGTRVKPWNEDFFPAWARMARQHENFYGDTAALNIPNRSKAYGTLLEDAALQAKLVHGSDWPVIPLPPIGRLGWQRSMKFMRESNWLRRDLLIKRALGFEEAYWHRAARLLRINI